MKKKHSLTRLAAAILIVIGTHIYPVAFAQTSEKPYTQVEQMPVFEGGEGAMLKFLGENMRYPKDARENGVEGLVVVQFVVYAEGSLGDLKVVKSLSTTTDAEAIRVIKLMDGRWQPGRQNGKAVAVEYTLPLRYAIKKEQKKNAGPDKQPQFKGGQEAMLQHIHQNLRMPKEAKKEHLNARVVVNFTIGKDGSVSDIRLAQTKLKKTVGPGADLDYMDATTFNVQNKAVLAKLSEAAVAAVKSTSGLWEPATANGQPIDAELVLPLQFTSDERDKAGK
jgi:TonB family protein